MTARSDFDPGPEERRREEVTLIDPAVLPDAGPYHTVMHLPRNAVQRIIDEMLIALGD